MDVNKLILKEGTIKLSGFGMLHNGYIYFALYTMGVAIYENVKYEKDYYYKALMENNEIKDEILYLLLKKRGYTEETYFIYTSNNASYLELEPSKSEEPLKL